MAKETVKELKDKISELELRLQLQKMHCKFYHRQKFIVWISNYWWRLIYKLKIK